MYSYQLVARLTQKKHKWVFCGDHIDCVFFDLARQLYEYPYPQCFGFFPMCKTNVRSIGGGGVVDIMSVGLASIIAKEETILKRRRKR